MRRSIVLVFGVLAAVAFLAAQVGGAAAPGTIAIAPIGTYATGVPFDGDLGTAEIPAYDPTTQRLFVVNAQQSKVDVLDLSDPSDPAKVGSVALDGTPNSVAVSEGRLAVAVQADPKTDPGKAVLYATSCDPATCTPLKEIEVGALPDMLTFSPSGRYLLVANEGEPETQNGAPVDPNGTVSVIDLREGVDNPIVDTVDFTSLDGKPVPGGAVLAPGRKPSEDFEPEYITVSTNSRTAWVSLQEANAIAEIDVADAELVAVRGLGFKDHGLAKNSLDASDREASLDGQNRGVLNMCAWANLYGIYMPDGIAAYQVRNRWYVVTANEGDSRDENNPFTDESRVGALPSASFAGSPFTSTLRANRNLGRLTVNKNLGLVNGVYQGLYVYGARSFSIWRDDGVQVYDSANELERIVDSFPAQTQSTDPYEHPLVLQGPSVPAAKSESCPVASTITDPAKIPPLTTPANSNHEEGPTFDNRSDNKGPEPEGVTLGQVAGRTYAFVGLERASGIMVYDVTEPAQATFVEYVNPRDFTATYVTAGAETEGDWQSAGDLGPEALVFVSEDDSPTGQPLLVVSNEVSGTTTVYAIAAT